MKDFMIDTFYKKRKKFEEESKIRYAKMPLPKGVHEITNVRYIDDDNPVHRMDIYYPETDYESLPVIINVHGGGLLLGNKEFNRSFCAEMCLKGYVVFSIEYSLVPENYVYQQFADLSRAMDKINTIIKDYKGNPEHVYVVGDSGGAYIITYSIAMQKCKKLADAAGVKPSALSVKALGLISGMFYTRKIDEVGLFLPKYLYGKDYKKSSFAPYTNPEHPDIVTSLPPCFLVTSKNDMLQHYTLNYAKALNRHNIPHELLNFGKNKKLTHAFSVFEPYMEESIHTMNKLSEFLLKY